MKLSSVSTAAAFQAALEAGVEHIVVAAHLDTLDVQPVPGRDDVRAAEALDRAVGRANRSTLSIVVRRPQYMLS